MIGRIHGRDDNDQWTVTWRASVTLPTWREKKLRYRWQPVQFSFPYSSNLKTRDNKRLEKSTAGTCTTCNLRQRLGDKTEAEGEPQRPRWTAQNVRTQAVWEIINIYETLHLRVKGKKNLWNMTRRHNTKNKVWTGGIASSSGMVNGATLWPKQSNFNKHLTLTLLLNTCRGGRGIVDRVTVKLWRIGWKAGSR